jgi:anthranilate synthase component 1
MDVTSVSIELSEKDPEKVYDAIRGQNTYLLESSDGTEKVARYSIIGFNPVAKLTIKGKDAELKILDSELKKLKAKGQNPLEITRNLMKEFTFFGTEKIRFVGGLVGYYAYDNIRHAVDLSAHTRDDLKQPDCELILAKNNVIFDHKKKETHLMMHLFSEDADKETARKKLQEIKKEIAGHVCPSLETADEDSKGYSSNVTQMDFEASVRVAKEYIGAGDVLQVVLSQRLQTEYSGDKFSVYRKLKMINPSPYMYFLDFGERKIAGSSPEMLLRVEGRRMETYPIAGTRRRGRTQAEDAALAREMLADEKERAEHLMLVDLGRNDIGRVADFGSVKVRRFMEVEKYSHVQHMVSEVCGKLRDGLDEFDALKSVFPAGTVSGAPKVRAMEIIEELEPTRRGIYSGCVGYMSFNRNMDTAITIRTIVFEKDAAYVQAGAGIVADSVPKNEYTETLNKGRGMLAALGVGK